jgi:excisionase family DNA binding protein
MHERKVMIQAQTTRMHTKPYATDRILLRASEVADALGIGRSKAYELIAAGVIPSIRVGSSIRVPIDALKAWTERQLTEATR